MSKTPVKNNKTKIKEFFSPSIIFALACCVGLIVLSVLAIIGLVEFAKGEGGENSYRSFIQLVFSISTILFLLLYILLVKFSGLKIKEPVSIFFVAFIFTFAGLYPAFNLFASSIAVAIFFVLCSFVFGIISLAIFFAFVKDQNGTARVTTGFLMFFIAVCGICFSTLLEVMVYLLGKWQNGSVIISLEGFMKNFGWSLLGLAIFFTAILISKITKRRLLNTCLILPQTKEVKSYYSKKEKTS